jgi:hypothetical protein
MRHRVLALGLSLFLSARAEAQTADEVARSKALFRAGASAYAAGDYSAAIEALQAAYELTPLPAIAFSLAQAERKEYGESGGIRHLERAINLFHRYLEETPGGRREADARDALNELEPELLRLRPAVPTPLPAPAAAPRPTRLMLVAEAPGAQIAIDEGPAQPSPVVREVTPGKHHVRAFAPGYATLERETMAVANELILTELTLAELPSVVSVYTPPHTDLYVDGALAGESDGRFVLQLPAGEHRLSASLKGHQLEDHRVRLARGQALALRFSPPKSSQRIVSEVLFCVSGAAVGAGIVLSGFAVRSENDAEDFIAQRSAHLVTSSELIGYQASLNDRDQFRRGAAVSFGAAVGLFVTGVFLRELDHPVPAEHRQTLAPHASRRSEERAAFRFDAVPAAPGAEAGASLRMRF